MSVLSKLAPSKLARFSARHPWYTVAFWLTLVVVAAVAATTIRFDNRQSINGTGSYKAQQIEDQVSGGNPVTETVVVEGVVSNVDDPAFRAFVAGLTQQLRRLDIVKSAKNYYETNDPSLVSADRTKTIIPLELTGSRVDAASHVGPLLKTLDEATANGNGFSAITAGDGSINHDLQESATSDLESGESIGLPAALLVLLLVFGAAVAAGVPVVLGLLGIVIAVGITALLSRFLGINSITVNMVTMIGLAVGIDYTLFIVERFREERHAGMAKIDAIVRAGDTASRAVLFSGVTVIIALTGLLIVPATTFRGMAVGAIAVVAAAIAIALTLLPALLSLFDHRLNWLHLPGRKSPSGHAAETGFWGRTTNIVVRHPLVAIVGTVAILIALAAPVVTMKLGNSGISDMPDNLKSVQAFHVLDRDFSAGRLAPAQVAISGDVNSPQVTDALAALRARVASDPDFGEMSDLKVNPEGDAGIVSVLVNGDATTEHARDAVQRLRDDYVPAAFDGAGVKVYVGGDSADSIDYVSTMNRYLPIVIAFVLSLSFVLLLVVFRSVVLPVKAIVMNMLSVGAAYGLLTLVFQHGVGAGLLGFHQSDTIAAFLPIFLFTVLFGLSMDYHVFLLSRIQERFLHTRDNTAAVSYGLRSTAQIITGAAAIMMVVFSGFALGDMVELQQLGFGLAVAVFLDATIVRSILVPASMAMLGEWNWYLPSWLGWLPRINVEGPELHEETPSTRVPRTMPEGATA